MKHWKTAVVVLLGLAALLVLTLTAVDGVGDCPTPAPTCRVHLTYDQAGQLTGREVTCP